MKFRKLSLSLAISTALGLTGTAFAQEESYNDSDVEIDKELSVDIDVVQRGFVQTLGLVLVDSTATAVSEVNQMAIENEISNGFDTTNNASISGDAIGSATGNIGLNVAAGDSNIQQNSAAMSRIVAPGSTGITIDMGYEINESSSDYSNSSNDFQADSSNSYSKTINSAYDNSASGSFAESSSGSFDVTADKSATFDTSGDSSLTVDTTTTGGAYADQMNIAASGYLYQSDDGAGNTTADAALNIDADSSGFYIDGTVDTSAAASNQYSASKTANSTFAAEAESSESEDGAFSFANSGDFNLTKEVDNSVSASHHDDEHSESAYSYNEYATFDADLVFGSALDAETFSNQSAYGNTTYNAGVSNSATVTDNVGSGASGNIGINVAAGSTNAQANQLALATSTDAVSALATASSNQNVAGNQTYNAPEAILETSGSFIALNGSGSGTYAGDILWEENEEDGPQATPVSEVGDIDLSDITLTGQSYNWSWAYLGHENTAELSGNALNGATGNIGVNIAAGTNNLQGNSLAIASVNNTGGTGTAGGGTL